MFYIFNNSIQILFIMISCIILNSLISSRNFYPVILLFSYYYHIELNYNAETFVWVDLLHLKILINYVYIFLTSLTTYNLYPILIANHSYLLQYNGFRN